MVGTGLSSHPSPSSFISLSRVFWCNCCVRTCFDVPQSTLFMVSALIFIFQFLVTISSTMALTLTNHHGLELCSQPLSAFLIAASTLADISILIILAVYFDTCSKWKRIPALNSHSLMKINISFVLVVSLIIYSIGLSWISQASSEAACTIGIAAVFFLAVTIEVVYWLAMMVWFTLSLVLFLRKYLCPSAAVQQQPQPPPTPPPLESKQQQAQEHTRNLPRFPDSRPSEATKDTPFLYPLRDHPNEDSPLPMNSDPYLQISPSPVTNDEDNSHLIPPTSTQIKASDLQCTVMPNTPSTSQERQYQADFNSGKEEKKDAGSMIVEIRNLAVFD